MDNAWVRAADHAMNRLRQSESDAGSLQPVRKRTPDELWDTTAAHEPATRPDEVVKLA